MVQLSVRLEVFFVFNGRDYLLTSPSFVITAYTPMMSAKQFVEEAAAISSEATVANSNICEFQTIPEDRPLVCHFSANDPQHFANAAKLVEPYCDAVDLNLGCPQRTAFVGHFGSYLLGDEDRYVHRKMLLKSY